MDSREPVGREFVARIRISETAKLGKYVTFQTFKKDTRPSFLIPFALALVFPFESRAQVTGSAALQLESAWDPRFYEPRVGGIDHIAIAEPEHIYVAGSGQFTSSGSLSLNHVAVWDGRTWTDIGGGVSGSSERTQVRALSFHEGKLFVGGIFDKAGSVPARKIAYWENGKWHAPGGGVNGGVREIVPLSDGSILVGGEFECAGNAHSPNVGRWTGTWRSFAGGDDLLGREVKTLSVFASGGSGHHDRNSRSPRRHLLHSCRIG